MSVKQIIRIVLIALAVAACVALGIQCYTIKRLAGERDKYRNNTTLLLGDIEQYRVRDSLNAARVQSLELSVKEFQRFRAEDAALIKDLKSRNRDLAAVNKTQSQTIIELMAIPRDTVVIRDSVSVPAVAVHCGDEWFDFNGLLTPVEFTGTLQTRDSLFIAETVQYKRFLGFLWKTHKVKNRWIDCVTKNPYSKIIGLEYVVIEK